MESPVVVDKPPEYCGNNCNEHGFPFDEESRSSAWSDLAARHPDIAARLRARPHNTWGRKRRPGSQDAAHEFGGGFDSFPFDDIPPEFREHFPSHWGRRFNPDEESSPQQTTSTQTEIPPEAQPSQPPQSSHLPQYGLRNTVDLGQKSPADPSLVDEQDRGQRSASAPPEANNTPSAMSHPQQHPDPPEGHPTHPNVRHIPIFVEGRDEPVCNKQNHAEPKRAYTPPNQDREQQYFAEEPAFSHPPNFSRPFGTFGKGFRQNAQPFTQQKVYPQSAFAKEGSPHRSQSPRPQPKETFVKVPVHAEPKPHPQAKPQAQQPQPPQQHKPQPQQHKSQPQQQQPPPPPPPAKEQSPEPPRPTSNDPITVILAIQTDVLNLMTEVEKFTGTKADKRYMYLDEMLTRNLIKLDNVETDGKENIRQARKEAIKCIQKCIAVLEAKADGRSTRPNQDVETNPVDATHNGENGEAEVKETKEENTTAEAEIVSDANQTEALQTDTRPEAEAKPADVPQETVATETVKKTPKKVKKSDKSKDKEVVQKEEVMQVDKPETNQSMEVDGATASQ